MENFEHQLRSMQSIIDSKLKECDDLRVQKNELALKANELNVWEINLIILKLMN
jgi:hypothetical protein